VGLQAVQSSDCGQHVRVGNCGRGDRAVANQARAHWSSRCMKGVYTYYSAVQVTCLVYAGQQWCLVVERVSVRGAGRGAAAGAVVLVAVYQYCTCSVRWQTAKSGTYRRVVASAGALGLGSVLGIWAVSARPLVFARENSLGSVINRPK
jgi:hypothetical protein